ncbi:helix-turn-helix domain-containing protein [Mycobacterium sp. IDR2000157661]|uniref:helix-turn-helix domain-containing protein n=1 Tax=Mycobacterium sp. IDR2000157661 TaxID=2867005 RepID=UPI001EEE5F02|nr:helix-turn-helix domain-containing protein [Mycobacterium sp. IDR2000157661]ULE35050.1 helix-turn-helix domain-containing protein [Mycobacterium sp. IDR2000157661]
MHPTAPTVPLEDAAERLGISTRHARRIAPKLAGRKAGGRWFVDETALREHLERT